MAQVDSGMTCLCNQVVLHSQRQTGQALGGFFR